MIIIKYIEAAFLSLIFCVNLIFFDDDALLKKVTSPPQKEEIYIAERDLLMDIYHPSSAKRVRSNMLIIHGATEFGKDDPRLVRICELFARLGFKLYVPNVRELIEWNMGSSGVDDIVYIYQRFLQPEEKLSRGMLSYSTGCLALFAAASREEISSDVDYLVSFGGYYDAKNMLLFMTTEFYNDAGIWKECPYEKEVDTIFLKKNIDLIEGEEEKEIVLMIIDEGPKKELIERLSDKNKVLVELLYNDDRNRFFQLYDKIDPSVKKLFQQSSPGHYLDKVKADCLIAHSMPDFVIPHTESRLLAKGLKDRVKGYYTFRFFSHVDRKFTKFDFKEMLLVYIPDMVKFYKFIYKLLTF